MVICGNYRLDLFNSKFPPICCIWDPSVQCGAAYEYEGRLQDIYGGKWSVGVSVEIITINEIYKVFGSVYFVSEGNISQVSTVVGQVVTEIN